MGARASEKGVTLHFFDKDLNETRPAVTGEYAFLFSARRPIDPNTSNDELGSQDWITDLIVVDNPIKLQDLKVTNTTILHTSLASMHVVVQWSVGNDKGRLEDRITLASGPKPPAPPPALNYVDVVKVMDPETDLKNSEIWEEWRQAGIGIFLE
jgi:hypothetical protein